MLHLYLILNVVKYLSKSCLPWKCIEVRNVHFLSLDENSFTPKWDLSYLTTVQKWP